MEQRLTKLRRFLDSERPLSRLERLCIQRQIDDLEQGHRRGLYWDEDQARRVVRFFSLLKHWKGRFARRPFILEPWQEELIVAPLFGWKMGGKDGPRRFRTGNLLVPRKQGKTALVAGVGTWGLVEGEEGAEVYCAANKRDQARILFRDVCKYIQASPELSRRLKVNKMAVYCPHYESRLEPISSDARTADGLNSHINAVDEIQEHRTRELLDKLVTGTASRWQPLTVTMGTSGEDEESLWFELLEYGERVLEASAEGNHHDDAFFSFISKAEEGDDPFDPKTWWKANPNLYVTIQPDYFQRELAKCKLQPAYLGDVCRLHLNLKRSKVETWLGDDDQNLWGNCYLPRDEWPSLAGKPAWCAVDLSSLEDLTAATLVVQCGERYFVECATFLPQATIERKRMEGRGQYGTWADSGLITTTYRDTTDYEAVNAKLSEWHTKYDMRAIGIDRWNSGAIVTHAANLGLEARPISQLFSGMSWGMKRAEELIRNRLLVHDGNPCLAWQIRNTKAETDSNDNKRPSKKASGSQRGNKIDNVVALIMAVGLATVDQDATSIYETERFTYIG